MPPTDPRAMATLTNSEREKKKESETNFGNERTNASGNNIVNQYRSACQQMLGLRLNKRLQHGFRLHKRCKRTKFANRYKRTRVQDSTTQTVQDTTTETFLKGLDQGTKCRTRVESPEAHGAPPVRQSASEHTHGRSKTPHQIIHGNKIRRGEAGNGATNKLKDRPGKQDSPPE